MKLRIPVTVVTTSRADYGIYQPVLSALAGDADFHLRLIVAGMHLRPEFGHTVQAVEADAYEIAARIDLLCGDDSPRGIARSIGNAVGLYGAAYADLFSGETMTDRGWLMVLGDRFEMHAAALAALPFGIPVAHLHGGELTFGAIDDALRHSLTKLSHLHFVSTADAARRVAQLGEAPWRITTSGAPALDHLVHMELPSREAIEERFGIPMSPAPLLVTFHPATLEHADTESHIWALLDALARLGMPRIFTLPNADTGGQKIAAAIRDHVNHHESAWLVESAGLAGYFGLMSQAAAMVGNSSSGILEAASFRLPVVNIGSRQAGRLRGANVRDCGYQADEIIKAVREVCSPAFRTSISGLVNPYGDGHAAKRIVARLKEVTLNEPLLMKRFHDLPC